MSGQRPSTAGDDVPTGADPIRERGMSVASIALLLRRSECRRAVAVVLAEMTRAPGRG